MIPLHKVPRGLLELLRARTLGANPAELAGVVAATVNATPMYGSDLQTVQSETGAAGAIDRTLQTVMTVSGRLLAMHGQVAVGAGAGTYLRMFLGYSPGPNLPIVWLADRYVTPTGGANNPFIISTGLLPEPIVFSPGAAFSFIVEGDAAGADHVPIRRDLFESYAPV